MCDFIETEGAALDLPAWSALARAALSQEPVPPPEPEDDPHEGAWDHLRAGEPVAGLGTFVLERAAWSLWKREPRRIETRVREGEMGWLVRDILREADRLAVTGKGEAE